MFVNNSEDKHTATSRNPLYGSYAMLIMLFASEMVMLLPFINCNYGSPGPGSPQGICVVNSFRGVHSSAAKQKPEDYRGLPLMTFPRVESPLETLSAQVHKES